MPNFTAYLILWSLLALTVLCLAIYRKNLTSKEDDSLHLSSVNAGAVQGQELLMQKLATVDKWGKMLTIVTAIAGVALAAWYIYYVWTDTGRMIVQ